MEDLTLAIVTLTSFVLLFVAAIFADRTGTEYIGEAPVELAVVTADVEADDVAEAEVA